VIERGPEVGDVLGDVRAFVRRFVVLDDAQADAVTLWAAATHAFESFGWLRRGPSEDASPLRPARRLGARGLCPMWACDRTDRAMGSRPPRRSPRLPRPFASPLQPGDLEASA
jgi:hypothetical protein